jgi:hypothetical protein
MKMWLAAVSLVLGFSVPALAGDYAAEISAYHRAHGLSAVRADSKLNAVALKQAQAMAASGNISHSAAGSFSARVAPLRKSRALKTSQPDSWVSPKRSNSGKSQPGIAQTC